MDPNYKSPNWQISQFDCEEEDWRNIPEPEEYEFEWEDYDRIIEQWKEKEDK